MKKLLILLGILALSSNAFSQEVLLDLNSNSVTATATVNDELRKLKDATNIKTILDKVYPVGCIYTSIVATNPATVFGFGTWVSFGSGKMLVGVDTGDADFNAAEKTGGAKTHTLGITEMPPHHHVSHVLCGGTDLGGAGSSHQGNTTDTGGGVAFNIMNPFITVYYFKRTA
jgi:hypothetical protein